MTFLLIHWEPWGFWGPTSSPKQRRKLYHWGSRRSTWGLVLAGALAGVRTEDPWLPVQGILTTQGWSVEGVRKKSSSVQNYKRGETQHGLVVALWEMNCSTLPKDRGHVFISLPSPQTEDMSLSVKPIYTLSLGRKINILSCRSFIREGPPQPTRQSINLLPYIRKACVVFYN